MGVAPGHLERGTSPPSAPHRVLPVPLDLRALLDNVVWSACLVSEEKEASLVFPAPL